ncbi:MAG: thiamine pyrophosphate-binding protein [Burkholderiales bacterium]|nr:thiamine pyrophosphate-binding protein [Burkholderiales bacterium]
MPGRTIFPFLKSANNALLQDIICASEDGAGFMAEGYAKSSNKYGVLLQLLVQDLVIYSHLLLMHTMIILGYYLL